MFSPLPSGEGGRRPGEGRRAHHGFRPGINGFHTLASKRHDPHPAVPATFSRGEKDACDGIFLMSVCNSHANHAGPGTGLTEAGYKSSCKQGLQSPVNTRRS